MSLTYEVKKVEKTTNDGEFLIHFKLFVVSLNFVDYAPKEFVWRIGEPHLIEALQVGTVIKLDGNLITQALQEFKVCFKLSESEQTL